MSLADYYKKKFKKPVTRNPNWKNLQAPPGYTWDGAELIKSQPRVPPGTTVTNRQPSQPRVANINQQRRPPLPTPANTRVNIPPIPTAPQPSRLSPTINQGYANTGNAAQYEQQIFDRNSRLMRESMQWQLLNSREQRNNQKQLQELRNQGVIGAQSVSNSGILERQLAENQARTYEADKRLSGQLGVGRLSKEAALGTADISARANRYSADKRLEGQLGVADINKQLGVYQSDQNLRGIQDQVQGRRDVASIQGDTQRDISKTQKSQAIWTQGIKSVSDYLAARERSKAQAGADSSRIYSAFLSAPSNFRYW